MKVELATNEQVIKWCVASDANWPQNWQKNLAQANEKMKAKIRTRVEHPFHVIKNIFKHKKTRYKGIAKNDVQLNM
jgi:IS5 family transposase